MAVVGVRAGGYAREVLLIKPATSRLTKKHTCRVFHRVYSRLYSMTAQYTSFGQSVRAARQKAGLGLRPLAQRSGIHYTGLRQLENGDFNPTLATALRLVSQVTGGNEAREKLLRLYLRKPRAGLLAHLLVAAALRRGGLKVTRQTKNQSRKSPIFDIVVDAGEHLKIGIVVKVIKRE